MEDPRNRFPDLHPPHDAMNAYQNAKLKSYRATVGVFARHPAETAAVPALERAVVWVRERVAELEAAVEAQAGYAPQGSGKAALRDDLAAATVPVAQAIAARADEAGDPTTADQFDVTPTDMRHGPEQDALDRASLTLDKATADAAALAEYGADQAAIDALGAARDAFADSLSGPRDAVVERRAHTEAIERLVPQIETRLKKRVDRMMTRYRDTAFGDEYRAARTVVDA